ARAAPGGAHLAAVLRRPPPARGRPLPRGGAVHEAVGHARRLLTIRVATTSRRHAVEAALLQLVHLSPGPLPQLTSAEWAVVPQLAARERVGPLAFRALERADAEVPDSVRSALRSSYEQAAAAAETIYWQAADLQRLLRGGGVPGRLFTWAA